MSPKDTIRRYPRLSRIILAIAEDTDPKHAADVIEAAKRDRKSFAHEVVEEAWIFRRQYRYCAYAQRVVSSIVADEVPLPSSHLPSSSFTSLF